MLQKFAKYIIRRAGTTVFCPVRVPTSTRRRNYRFSTRRAAAYPQGAAASVTLVSHVRLPSASVAAHSIFESILHSETAGTDEACLIHTVARSIILPWGDGVLDVSVRTPSFNAVATPVLDCKILYSNTENVTLNAQISVKIRQCAQLCTKISPFFVCDDQKIFQNILQIFRCPAIIKSKQCFEKINAEGYYGKIFPIKGT